MKLTEFLLRYDYPGSIALLVGKRIVKNEDSEKLVSLGTLIAQKSKHLKQCNPKKPHVLFLGSRKLFRYSFHWPSFWLVAEQ